MDGVTEHYLEFNEDLDPRSVLSEDRAMAVKGKYFGRDSNTYLIRLLILKGYSRSEVTAIMIAIDRDLDYTYVSREWRLLVNGLKDMLTVVERPRRMPSYRGRKDRHEDRREWARDMLRQAGLLDKDIIITSRTRLSAQVTKRLSEITAKKIMFDFVKKVGFRA